MSERYWMAATDFPGMWAIGEGDKEVAHVHDRDLAAKIRNLLNDDEKMVIPFPFPPPKPTFCK